MTPTTHKEARVTEFRKAGPARALAVLVIVAAMAGALPAAAVAHGNHPSTETELPAPSTDSSSGESAGGASPVLVGVLIAGLLGVTGGLIYVRERQRRGPSEPVTAETPKTPKSRARGSW
jgi:hypothetical protein